MPGRAIVTLTRIGSERVKGGHLWIYRSEARSIDGPYGNGDAVDVHDESGAFCGRGYVNDRSQILVRLWTHRDEELGTQLLRQRIDEALAYRRACGDDRELGRLVNAEGDRLPGLIVDRYGSVLVVQVQSLGLEAMRGDLEAVLRERFPACSIYERSDTRARELEGLEKRSGFWGTGRAPSAPAPPRVVVRTPLGLEISVDLAAGQKTGAYLDQIDNQSRVAHLSRGRSVLDAFCHEGGFGLSALQAGAARAVLVDLSETALARAQENAARNGLAPEIVRGNVFDLLRAYERDGARFGTVVLDPPAFTKSKAQLDAAYRGYKEINLRALRIVDKDGFLFTSSCSYHVSREMFRQMLHEAALDSGRIVRIVEERSAGADHPELATMPETRYLKCLLAHVA